MVWHFLLFIVLSERSPRGTSLHVNSYTMYVIHRAGGLLNIFVVQLRVLHSRVRWNMRVVDGRRLVYSRGT